jgi:hypothetical protein
MRKSIFLLLLSFVLIICFGCAEKQEEELTELIKDDLRKDASQFMESLRMVLMNEMQTNGVVAAVNVCSDTAQTLTDQYSAEQGVYIRRISFNNRNEANVPDEFEAEGLKYFEELKNSGNLDQSTELFEVVEDRGVRSVRYLRPIIIQAPCLNCHGTAESISPEVRAIINDKYPDDKATGYNSGDLRGAVSVRQVL